MSTFLWWGYLHTNGNLQVKRYWGRGEGGKDLADAYESDFVDRVIQPFNASGRDEALSILSDKLGLGK